MISQQVRVAATVMDRLAPGWERAIDVARLDIRSCTQCIGGQVYDAPNRVGFATLLTEMEDGGFDPYDYPAFLFDSYTAEWVELIKFRFDNGTLSDLDE